MSRTGDFYLPEGLTQPAPMPDGLDAPFWEGTRNHERSQECFHGRCLRIEPSPYQTPAQRSRKVPPS